MEEYKLCYIEGNKAWFTNNFENQDGDDWDDAPYEYNAGEPYDSWGELIKDSKKPIEREWKDHEIKHKHLYFEMSQAYTLPLDLRFLDDDPNSPYSVEDINKRVVPWIHTKTFNIYAGTTYEEFIDVMKLNGAKIYVLKEN